MMGAWQLWSHSPASTEPDDNADPCGAGHRQIRFRIANQGTVVWLKLKLLAEGMNGAWIGFRRSVVGTPEPVHPLAKVVVR